MKTTRVMMWAALALALALAPSTPGTSARVRGDGHPPAPPSSPVPVASLDGAGRWGRGVCYGCIGMALGTALYAPYLTSIGLAGCVSLCQRVQ